MTVSDRIEETEFVALETLARSGSDEFGPAIARYTELALGDDRSRLERAARSLERWLAAADGICPERACLLLELSEHEQSRTGGAVQSCLDASTRAAVLPASPP